MDIKVQNHQVPVVFVKMVFVKMEKKLVLPVKLEKKVEFILMVNSTFDPCIGCNTFGLRFL